MDSDFLGLVELALVFALVLGWGVWELVSLRRGRSTDTPRKPDKDEPPAPGAE
jgi:hypothetical protein